MRGGDDTAANLTASCGHCNKSKHDESLLVFLWKRSLEDAPPQPSPRAGVHWRRDLKRWTAYVDCVRRYQLGHFDDPDDAVRAIEEWWRQHPEAMSPRKRRQQEHRAVIQRMWSEGRTIREIAEALGITHAAAVSAVNRARAAEGLPYVGRGGPGKRRPSRKGTGRDGKGYSYNAQSPSRPWLVQVQRLGHKVIARFATEEEAQAAVARFRAEHYKS